MRDLSMQEKLRNALIRKFDYYNGQIGQIYVPTDFYYFPNAAIAIYQTVFDEVRYKYRYVYHFKFPKIEL